MWLMYAFIPFQELGVGKFSIEKSKVQKLVLAFYYPWYGTPEYSGKWRHYDSVPDVENKDIKGWAHYPLYGPYDSKDPKVVERHFKQMKECGIDGVVVSWWGVGTFEDEAMDTIMEKAEELGVLVTVYYETVSETKNSYKAILKDLTYIKEKYGKQPAFLKINNTPVVFVYGRVLNQVDLLTLKKAVDKAGVFAVVDCLARSGALLFGGIHTYLSPSFFFNMKSEREIYRRAKGHIEKLLSSAGSSLAVFSICPGYDDHEVPGRTNPVVDRYNGKLYETQWKLALKYNPDWVVILTWNEWHEGTEIEPSVEFGDRYLKLTKKYAFKFKAKKLRKIKRKKEFYKEALVSIVEGRRIVSVGGVNIFSLLCGHSGANVIYATWNELDGLLDPKKDIVVYEDGEAYNSKSVDVLKSFLKRGGALIACPYLPFPFYYNEKDEAHPVAAELLLPISGSGAFGRLDYMADVRGFETPPREDMFFKINKKYLTELPERIPFPKAGDRRFRPLVPVKDAKVYKLISLYDPDGNYYGEAAAVLKWPSGASTAYVWFRIWDFIEKPEVLINTVLRLVTSEF